MQAKQVDNTTNMYKRFFVIVTGLILFIVPFFWLPTGYADLGGDGIRIYFLDPGAFIRNFSLFNILPYYSYIPHLWVLGALFEVIKDIAYRVAFFNGLKLSLSFISMYAFLSALVVERSRKELGEHLSFASAYVGAIVYVSCITVFGWYQSLLIQYNILLNPLLAYVILSYLRTKQSRYLILFICVNFIFSPNFGFTGLPQLLSFLALFIPFIFLYHVFVLKIKFPFKEAGILLLVYVGTNAYHLLPTIRYVFDTASGIYARTFIGTSGVAKSYFFDVNRYSLGGISRNIFVPAKGAFPPWLSVVIPILTIGGFLKSRSKLQLLTGGVFLIGFYLVSANITVAGGQLYRLLYSIPGFSMFQYFNEKWYHAYVFFYVVLFALSFHSLTRKFHRVASLALAIVLTLIVVYCNLPFLRGDTVKAVLPGSNNLTPVVRLSGDFLNTVSFIRTLPPDGKMLTIPLTFPYVQLLFGDTAHGIYAGPSLLPILSGKSDFAGFWEFGVLQKQVETSLLKKDYPTFLNLLSALNIRYIFYNSDTRIMDDFPGYPYYTTDEFPALRDQKSYQEMLSQLPIKPVYQKGYFTIYEIDERLFKSLISVQDAKTSFSSDWPGHYSVSITPAGTRETLIFREPYNSSWSLHFNESTGIRVLKHFEVDGYANGFLIALPQKFVHREVIGEIRNSVQLYFLAGSVISVAFLVGFGIYVVRMRRAQNV